MNKSALDRLINGLVLNKYSWIEDFEIKVHTFRTAMGDSKKIAFESYLVIYYVYPDKEDTVTDNELIEVEELTETLFRMIAPEHYQRFKGVEFYINDK